MESCYCPCCKRNYTIKGHHWSNLHQSTLKEVLAAEKQKVLDIKHFVRYPTLVIRDGSKVDIFQCTFCEKDINNDRDKFVCQQLMKHLASKPHMKAVKKYLLETKAREKFSKFCFRSDDVAKFERNALRKVQEMEEEDADESPGSKHLHLVSNDFVDLPATKQPVSELDTAPPDVFSQSSTLKRKRTSFAYGENLTVVPLQSDGNSSGTQGNVHTGATPPWLDSPLDPAVSVAAEEKKKRKKERFPNKLVAVGRSKETEKKKPGANWLPDFGTVWQAGPRSETRNEFRRKYQ